MSAILDSMSGPDRPHHITCVVHQLLPLFSQPDVVAIVFDSWRRLRRQSGLRLYGYVVMEEHLHFLAQAQRLDLCLDSFREQTAGRIIAYLEEQRLERFLKRLAIDENGQQQGRRYRIWQEETETEVVGEGMMAKTLEYIHINPVKRGYVDRAEQWRYSSARDYGGENGLFEIDVPGEQPVA